MNIRTYSTSNLMLKIIAFQRNVKLFRSFHNILLSYSSTQVSKCSSVHEEWNQEKIYFFMKLEITRRK